ncbi:MAG TPA: PfkB family carbohydrate kinase [Flavitalea sp.]|nr:PfkB family carbohydrate kinase [Flavitalea sp.]
MLLDIVDNFIEKVKDLNIAVIGETITDEFVFVSYEGQSMKSICPVFKTTGRHEIQAGGAAAIANHLRDFVKKVDLFSNPGGEIVKTRYIDVSDQKKHVEINRFNLTNNKKFTIDVNMYDVVIVADFGHGFCEQLSINDGFHLMCQTNSNNFGFNRVSKWKNYKKKSVCIDLREASLQLNKKGRFTEKEEVDELFNYELCSEHLFITLGSQGSLFYDGKKIRKHECFRSSIVDTIGAGDTFYAFVTLATCVDQADELLVVPSLSASLSTTWLCNEKFVTKKALREYAAQSL